MSSQQIISSCYFENAPKWLNCRCWKPRKLLYWYSPRPSVRNSHFLRPTSRLCNLDGDDLQHIPSGRGPWPNDPQGCKDLQSQLKGSLREPMPTRYRQHVQLLFEAYAHELMTSEDKEQIDGKSLEGRHMFGQGQRQSQQHCDKRLRHEARAVQ